jgi:N-sulfoglucosamine sulfohydrolase
MIGLAHRGFRLRDYGHHLVHTLRQAGYWSGLVGEQHLSVDPEDLGYDAVGEVDSTHVESVVPATLEVLRSRPPDRPFFLSVGFFETHREFFESSSVRDALYSSPPPNLPDTPEVRRDMASFKSSARSLDQGVGAVLNALDEQEVADDTLVVLTTDHGLPFPGAKASLLDRGIGVMLIIRGPGGFQGGRVTDALVSQIDIYPTLCEVAGIDPPPFVQGRSLLPIVRREVPEVNDEIFAELTFHAAYDPQRAIRTRRHKYIRLFGDKLEPVLPNIDEGPTKELLVAAGYGTRPRPRERLHDLLFDPMEADNVVDDPDYADVLADLRERMEEWMRQTDDPLLHGPVEPPEGAELNDPAGLSAAESPTGEAAIR